MNEWIRHSLRIAGARGYLDRLHDIYPVGDNVIRELPVDAEKKIQKAFDARDREALLKALFALERFPIKDPYIALLRSSPKFLKSNPQTIRRVTDKLFEMGVGKIIQGAKSPKEANTQIGPQFRRWLQRLGFPFLGQKEFSAVKRGIYFLAGADADLRRYANSVLNSGLDKEPDFVARSGSEIVVGEAKFLSASGGHQSTSLQDALRMVKGSQGKAHRVAVLDGIIWFPFGGKMHEEVRVSGSPLISALLLERYLKEL